LAFGNQIVTTTSAAQTLTLTNNGGLGATGITVAVTAPFAKSGGTCGATLAAGASCTINVTFTPTTAVSYTGMATVTANVTVNGSPAALSGFGMARAPAALVTPSSLAFGNWATGATSNSLSVTVTNTGNLALSGGTFSATTRFTRVVTGTFPTGAPNCAATLALGSSCTIKVAFAPASVGAVTGTLTVAYGAVAGTPTVVTNSPVALTGTGVAP
jgi:hypothetical protein